jgi:hypothetical protein
MLGKAVMEAVELVSAFQNRPENAQRHPRNLYLETFYAYIICRAMLQDRPSTKVQAAPGGGSSLDYLFSGSKDGK